MIGSLERGICSFIRLDIEMVMALTEVQRCFGWRSEGRFGFILRFFKRPLGGELFENLGESYLGTGAKRDDFKGSNMHMMSAEATGVDNITRRRKEEGNGKWKTQ